MKFKKKNEIYSFHKKTKKKKKKKTKTESVKYFNNNFQIYSSHFL